MNVLYSVSGGFALFFMILLLSKNSKQIADYILTFWFGIILVGISIIYLNFNSYNSWQGLNEIADSIVLLHGPLIWLYTLALTKEKFRLQKHHFWHFTPFLLVASYLFIPLLLGRTVTLTERNTILVLKMLHLLVYSLIVYWILRRHEKRISNYFSFTEKVELGWLKLLTIGIIIIWFISVISQILFAFNIADIPQYGGYFTNSAICIFVLIIGYFGIKQTSIFTPNTAVSEKQPSYKKETNKNDLISAVETNKESVHPLFQKLLTYMKTAKPYKNGNLSIYDLAGELVISPHLLSKIINQNSGSSFFDFINQYRVNDVKESIINGEHHSKTLLSIGLDAGFNSKASFNRVFKKKVGMTPREFANSNESTHSY